MNLKKKQNYSSIRTVPGRRRWDRISNNIINFKDYSNRKNKNNNSRVNNRAVISKKRPITLPISKMLQKFGAKTNRDNILAKKRSELNMLIGGGRMNTTIYNKIGNK